MDDVDLMAAAFGLAYLVILTVLVFYMTAYWVAGFAQGFLQRLEDDGSKLIWDYGTCGDRFARRHRFRKNVQFILWKVGEQGHIRDYWHNFDSSHWASFNHVGVCDE